MESRTKKRAVIKSHRFPSLSATGSRSRKMKAEPVPARIKGIRLPMGVLIRSESVPNSGSRNRARTLSAAMIAPVSVSPRWKVFLRIRGMILSYICQKAQMDKKAIPIKTVRL